MRKVLVVFMVLVLASAAFACDIKISHKSKIWIEDVPCCIAIPSDISWQQGMRYKRCDKLSSKDFREANNILKKISRQYTQLHKCKDEEKKALIKEKINVLNKELKDITGNTYGEVFNILTKKLEEAGF